MTPEELSKEADRCVKCGLCLPHCPTYILTRDEGDAPRGRIALIQGFVDGSLDSPRLIRHLERCLGCRRCETACPSGVRYGRIIDAARALGARPGGSGRRRLLRLLTRLPYHRSMPRLLRWYRTGMVRGLMRGLVGQRLRRLDDMLPPEPPAPAPSGETGATGQVARVALFTGCVGRIADRGALEAAERVLASLGITTLVPEGQGCCGAMHQHNGFPDDALALARANGRAFAALDVDAVLYLASGCGTQLQAYGSMAVELGAPPLEISRYLEQSGLAGSLRLAALDGTVAVHTPCTLRYPLGGSQWPLRLLQRIPGITLKPLPDLGCCGAAGTQVLTQPGLADRLRETILTRILELRPRLLVTSNTGCAMHLRAGLKQKGSAIEVLHPIEVIERQLKGPRGEGRGPRKDRAESG
ncbi:MAG TPA: 4Fe-4S dicluster domain-containing protein [Sedimenticola thiotaurini]|uniref:Glycolate oxidase iron-sulfur subunit n=1 Tax=Sedimenticola thiotaurini TaxID=1543721 RepID=A0A831RKT5_9GAMM|nr:4Fe-4S dicluster domain-containing protein [Sedimenticola thiotaurini]